MHVELHPTYRDTPDGEAAKKFVSACVHCGFCLATCPTYLDAQDERDSPRGRIYLIKALLETGDASQTTQTHLDRCLTCRSCETTCPSGVEYGALVDIGRRLTEQHVIRPLYARVARWCLRKVISNPALFAPLLAIGQFFRPLLPAFLKRQIPLKQVPKTAPSSQQARTMLVLEGCVQNAATPNTNAVAKRVFDRLGISLVSVKKAGCCGAVNYHLSAENDALDDMRRNIDAWWPSIEAGSVEAIVSTASGCGSMLADYGKLLAQDPAYADKALRVTALSKDISEVLRGENLGQLAGVNLNIGKVAIQTPCSLQHALKQADAVPDILARMGFDLAATTDNHLCCGSAGTYSILQSAISGRLLVNKLQALNIDHPCVIVTANVGCQLQLAAQSEIPVHHWIELLDELPP